MSAETTSKMQTYALADSVIREIQAALTIPESGGILGVREGRMVSEFYHDSTGTTDARNYIPDIDSLNAVLRDWNRRGIKFVGFVHSHPPNKENLSKPDKKYANKIKTYCGMDEILMLIYLPDLQTIYQYVL